MNEQGKSLPGIPFMQPPGWGCGGSCVLILASMLNGWIPHESGLAELRRAVTQSMTVR